MEERYLVRLNGKVLGPFPVEEAQALLQSSGMDTMVCREGTDHWVSARDVAVLSLQSALPSSKAKAANSKGPSKFWIGFGVAILWLVLASLHWMAGISFGLALMAYSVVAKTKKLRSPFFPHTANRIGWGGVAGGVLLAVSVKVVVA